MSRIIRFTQTGGPEVLSFQDVAVRPPGSGEIRITAKALGINRAEAMFRAGEYIEEPILPAGLGYEVAGIVEALGSDVTGFAIGDAVNVIPAFSLNTYPMYGELVIAPAYAVVPQPGAFSVEEAASVWMMFVTAYGALVEIAKLTAGDSIVIPAASSSVGIAAIQIGNMLGATTIALTRTDAKRKRLLELGAKHVVVTGEGDLTAEILRITDGKGARVIFDPVGGPDFPRLIKAVAVGGQVIVYGALSAEPTPLPMLEMVIRRPTITAANIASTTTDPDRLKAAVAFLTKGFSSRELVPVIDRTFAFDEIVEAHRYLESSVQFGKIVVTV